TRHREPNVSVRRAQAGRVSRGHVEPARHAEGGTHPRRPGRLRVRAQARRPPEPRHLLHEGRWPRHARRAAPAERAGGRVAFRRVAFLRLHRRGKSGEANHALSRWQHLDLAARPVDVAAGRQALSRGGAAYRTLLPVSKLASLAISAFVLVVPAGTPSASLPDL